MWMLLATTCIIIQRGSRYEKSGGGGGGGGGGQTPKKIQAPIFLVLHINDGFQKTFTEMNQSDVFIQH